MTKLSEKWKERGDESNNTVGPTNLSLVFFLESIYIWVQSSPITILLKLQQYQISKDSQLFFLIFMLTKKNLYFL